MTWPNYFCSYFYRNSLLFSITFLTIFVAKCISFLVMNWKWLIVTRWVIWKWCICWVLTFIILSFGDSLVLIRFKMGELKLLCSISMLKRCWFPEEEHFVNEQRFFLLKCLQKYLLLFECRFEMDVLTYDVLMSRCWILCNPGMDKQYIFYI